MMSEENKYIEELERTIERQKEIIKDKMENNPFKNLSEQDRFILMVDLYCLRFVVKEKWYELFDYMRDCLKRDGMEISYTKDDLLFGKIGYYNGMKNTQNPRSMKKLVESTLEVKKDD